MTKVAFGDVKTNNNLIDEKIVNNWQAPSAGSCHGRECRCHFIPPHIQQKINEVTAEIRKEQIELHDKIINDMRGLRSLLSREFEELESHKIFDFHKKSTQEQGEALQLIYDANKSDKDLPGKKITHIKDSHDKDTVQAYNGGTSTFVFLKDIFKRDSINNRGMLIKSSVNFGENFNNAFWNRYQMVYGKGDGVFLHNLTHLDVVAHELGHGVTQYTVNFDYQGQSGALNESLSDVYGSLVKQYTLKQNVEEADWKIGDDVVVAMGQCLRSMKNPGTAYDNAAMGKDPQPASMDAYDNTTEDNDGVHINSGIPNKAFYVTCNSLGGNSWDKAAHIWHSTMSNFNVAENKHFDDIEPLSPTTNFEQFATRTVQIAGKLYGKESQEQKAVIYAWNDVKVKADV